MYKCNIGSLNPANRVELLELIKHHNIEYMMQSNEIVIFKIIEEIEDFLTFHEIFGEYL